jgi:endonuclease YncB( thermonuclease family)
MRKFITKVSILALVGAMVVTSMVGCGQTQEADDNSTYVQEVTTELTTTVSETTTELETEPVTETEEITTTQETTVAETKEKVTEISYTTKSSSDAVSHSPGDDLQEGVLYEATVVYVIRANEITLQMVSTGREAKFKYISLHLPEVATLENVLEYIPEDEIEDIDGIRQMILDDDSIKDEDKQKIRVYDIIRYKLKEGDTVYIEFDKSMMPNLPSDKDYYAYIWFYANEQDKASDKLIRFQDWALSNGYAQIMTDPLNKKYLDYFTELEQNANDTFTGLWNGFFKYEMAKEINLESETTE